MSDSRLAAGVEASAFLARARDLGGFGTILRRGDAERGSLMLLLAERGKTRFLLQRLLQRNGGYAWESRESADSESLDRLSRQASERDPDLWLIELDVPSPERLIAELG
jgi:hypothetical protein